MNEVRIVGNDLIISVDEVTATIENAALIEDNRRLQAENEKLRELCKNVYEFVYECQLGCEQYLASFDAERAMYDENACADCWMERSMRELGVEV